MILVKPFTLLRCEHVHIYRCLVYGAERERFKLKEASKLGFFVRRDKQRVLRAHAEVAFKIQAWLIGHSHAGMQRGGFPLLTYRHARRRIELRACCTIRKLEVLQL